MIVDLLLRNVNLATMTAPTGYGEVPKGALAVRDAKIVWLGPDAEVPRDCDAAAEFNCGNQWLLPGLIDCHTHLVWAGNRADEFERRLSGHSYQEIAKEGGGILATVRATRSASPEELFTSSRLRMRDLIKEGVTTVEIKSGYGLDIPTELKCLDVAKRLGVAGGAIRVQPTYLGAHALPPEFAGRADDYVEFICAEALPAVAALGGVVAVDAFCESIAFSPAQCR